MNFYSQTAFCDAIAAAFFPGESVKSRVFELEGKLWQIPTVNGEQLITAFPIPSKVIDFFEPLSEEAKPAKEAEATPLKYLSKACQGQVTAEVWFEDELEENYEPAPTVLWENFETWEAFLQFIKQRKSKKFMADSRRRRRKLEEAVGPLEFVLGDDRPEILKTCMAWKSQQYQSTGEFDDFAQPETVRLFEELAQRGLLSVSSLSSAAGPIAIDINLYHNGRLYSWIASYDRDYSTYAPGRLLLLEALEASYRAGHCEFDFLIGNESYKWTYATHARLIAPLGTPSLGSQTRSWVSSSIKPFVRWGLKPFPGLKGKLKTLALRAQKG